MSDIIQIEKEIQALTVKDKVNVSYLLARQIITFQQAILNPHSEKDTTEAINGLVEMIPDAWKDDKWTEEIENAKVVEKIDVRPLVAGRLRMSFQICRELGIEPYETKEVTDPNKLFHACINLLFRRGLISEIRREQIIAWDGEENK